MSLITTSCIKIITSLIIFLCLHLILQKLRGRWKKRYYEGVDNEHYLPKEEVRNLRQLGYLIIIFLCFVNIAYILFNTGLFDYYNFFYAKGVDKVLFYVLDIVLSLFLSLNIDLRKDRKNQILFLLLVPYFTLELLVLLFNPIVSIIPIDLVTGGSIAAILDLMRIVAFIYFIRRYYIKFLNYTRDNNLGRTILIFFTLIVVTFIITIITENVTILESINMVSNAFASNGYVISGTTIIGQINEIFIVWGGYIFSNVGTATLTAAILIRHFDRKFKHYGDMNERFDKLKEMIEEDEY